MKSKRLAEVREVLESEAFTAWHRRFIKLRQDAAEVREQHTRSLEEINILQFRQEATTGRADDTLFHAGECEDIATRAHADYSEIDNDSYEVLSAFEDQRGQAAEAKAHLDRLDQVLEDHRQRAAEIRAALDAAVRSTRTADAYAREERLAAELEGLDRSIASQSPLVEEARTQLAREEGEEDRLWCQVQDTWSAAFRANMARFEFGYQAARVRADAEAHFRRAAAQREQLLELREASQKLAVEQERIDEELRSHVAEARKTLDCTLVEEFLYWPQADDVQRAYCVPLIDVRDHLNIQVKALQVYHVDRATGISFIEPMPDSDASEDGARLEAFFAPAQPTPKQHRTGTGNG